MARQVVCRAISASYLRISTRAHREDDALKFRPGQCELPLGFAGFERQQLQQCINVHLHPVHGSP